MRERNQWLRFIPEVQTAILVQTRTSRTGSYPISTPLFLVTHVLAKMLLRFLLPQGLSLFFFSGKILISALVPELNELFLLLSRNLPLLVYKSLFTHETQISSTYPKYIGFYVFWGSMFLICGFVHFLLKLNTHVFSSQVQKFQKLKNDKSLLILNLSKKMFTCVCKYCFEN